MRSPYPHPDASADEQAALWAARLDGSSLSTEDRAELDTWLAARPAHRGLLSSYCQFSADLERQLPTLAGAGRLAVPVPPAGRRKWTARWALGSGLAAAAAVAFVGWIATPVTPPAKYATAAAQRQSLTLADGTRVELNAHSSLVVQQGKTERRVTLAEGEAFFTVSKDPARPFIVQTPTGSVRVTGTTFNVRTDAAPALEVTVVEGSVQVRPREMGGAVPGDPVALAAGDRLLANASGVQRASLGTSDVENALAWRRGQVFFQDAPLREVLARFARYHGRGITVTPGAASQTLSGLHGIEDLDGFFILLQKSLPVRVNSLPNGTIRVSLANER